MNEFSATDVSSSIFLNHNRRFRIFATPQLFDNIIRISSQKYFGFSNLNADRHQIWRFVFLLSSGGVTIRRVLLVALNPPNL
jgi:hypothetical protein